MRCRCSILLFILVPIVELWAIIQVGAAIGVLPTIALLIIDSIARRLAAAPPGPSGLARASTRTLVRGPRARRRETADGALVIFGGALLMTPGFVTDILGAILLLVPPTRALVRRLAVTARRRAPAARPFGPAGAFTVRGRPVGAPARRPPRGRRGYDVEGTATEVADEPPRPADAAVSVSADLDAPHAARGDGFSDALTISFGDPRRRRLRHRPARARRRLDARAGSSLLFDGAEIATVAAESGVGVEDGRPWDAIGGGRDRRRDASSRCARWRLSFAGEDGEPRPRARGARPRRSRSSPTSPSPSSAG